MNVVLSMPCRLDCIQQHAWSCCAPLCDEHCDVSLVKKQLYLLVCWCSGALWGLLGPQQPLTRTAVLQVQSLSRAWQFPLLWGPLAWGAQSANNNNIQHAGQGSDTNCDPPHHSTRPWTGARTQSRCSLGEQGGEGWGGAEGVGLWVAEVFGLLSLPATTTLLVEEEGLKNWLLCNMGGTVY